MKPVKQLSYWKGKFGDAYIKRNSNLAFFEKRGGFFSRLLKQHKDIASILEVGCNIGGNLQVIQNIHPEIRLAGIEPNKTAATHAQQLIPQAQIINASIFDAEITNTFDLVFTSGVLIHIATEELKLALQKMHSASRKYLLSIEYFSETSQIVPYRNLADALFKRPYDKEWLAIDPNLKLVDTGFVDKTEGFDNCHWWLYQKIESL